MREDELKEKISIIRTWQRGDIRAPHKSLLLVVEVTVRLESLKTRLSNNPAEI